MSEAPQQDTVPAATIKVLSPKIVNKVLVLRGAQPLHPIMLQQNAQEGTRNLKYAELIKTVWKEEAMLDDKRESLSPELTAGVKVSSEADVNTKIDLLKFHISQIVDMMTLLTIRVLLPLGEGVSGLV